MGKTYKTKKDIYVFRDIDDGAQILPKGSVVTSAEEVEGWTTKLDDGYELLKLPKGFKGHNAHRYKTNDYQWFNPNLLEEIK